MRSMVGCCKEYLDSQSSVLVRLANLDMYNESAFCNFELSFLQYTNFDHAMHILKYIVHTAIFHRTQLSCEQCAFSV